MVKVRLSKTTKIIIILIIVVLLGGSGGYLLWRINQQETVAPTDSDAGGGSYGSCPTNNYYCTCGADNSCATTADNVCGGKIGCTCYRCQCANGVWVTGIDCAKRCEECKNDIPAPAGECTVGSQCPACEWPEVAYCGSNKCGCILPNNIPAGQLSCGEISLCTPGACPTGWTNCGISGDGLSKTGCTAKTSCTSTCTVCANKSTVHRYCKQGTTTTNTCDDGSWNSKPSGIYEYCENISYSALATDSDGIDTSSIVVKLNNVAKTTFSKSSTSTTTTITDVLSSSSSCLDPGSYTLDLSWKDTKGASSTDCTLSTTFTVQEEDEPPPEEQDWAITKQGVEECLNEDTETPTSVVTYTITVTNNAPQQESIDKIVDVLDTKVQESYVGDISGGGTLASGSITWELEDTDEVYAAEQSKTYTYSISIPYREFGSYTNTVTAYPREGDNISDDETIIADCVITPDEQPQTGIFDSTISKVILGIVMILIGFNLHRITSFVKRVDISVNEMSDERRKKNFERKIVKK
ncbi:MAG: hypothetical protein PHE21_02080 [Candidatus Dojkabacteria bacterium]|nr:hypothetical protein [Candidatus Dojkabacteria bacterium]